MRLSIRIRLVARRLPDCVQFEPDGPIALYQMLALGGVEERLIEASDQLETGELRPQFPYSWSVDGRRRLCSSVASQGNVISGSYPMVGESTPWAFAKTPLP